MSERNKHKKGHSFNHQSHGTNHKSLFGYASHLFPVRKKKQWKMYSRVDLMSSQMFKCGCQSE